MLMISRTQVATFEARAQESFRERVLVYVKDILPAQTEKRGESDLEQLVRDSETRASTYGIVTERGITKWVCLSLLIGPAFDRLPAVHQMLTDSSRDVEKCFEAAFERLCEIAGRAV
jgi:hypothetical protein